MVLFLVLLLLIPACNNLPVEHKVVQAKNDEIRIPLSELNDGGVYFFTYKGWSKRINFLVRRDGKGNLRAHFDACFACYRKKKGYRVEGKNLGCNECNERYDLTEEVWRPDKMGCFPIPLKSTTTENELIIRLKDIKQGRLLF